MDTEKLTPMMRQYLDIKASYEDSILFFRMGDFYEMFFEDAECAARVLGITLTSRDKDKKIPMCGIPYHALDNYLPKLVNEGYKVSICEQVGDPSASKGVVERVITRVVTPGTVDASSLDRRRVNNYIASAHINPKGAAAIAYMDVTTGEFRSCELDGHDLLIDEILRISPAELVLPDYARSSKDFAPISTNQFPEKFRTYVDGYDFKPKVALEKLLKHYSVSTLDGFGLREDGEAVRCAGALVNYVSATQKTELKHIKRCVPYSLDNYLILDTVTRRNLEISGGSKRESKGTLLGLLDRTRTSMGRRMLAGWLESPLVEIEPIRRRHEAIEELIEKHEARSKLVEILSDVYDLERLIGKVSIGSVGPRDMVSLKDSLEKVPLIKKALGSLTTFLIKDTLDSLDGLEEMCELVSRAIKDSPPALVRDGGYIREGYDTELDELREASSGGKDTIASLEASEREATSINSLKVGYNKVFGYYIEVSKTHTGKVPEHYIRKQTLVAAERYVTPELKKWEASVLGAEERALRLEASLFAELRKRLLEYVERVQTTATRLALLDVLASLATVAEDYDYTRPSVDDSLAINITGGRHPVVEREIDDDFIANDLTLDSDENQLVILTGPNMAGKSTYIRQVAIIVLMAQAGSFVPAVSAEIGVVDKIFTRIGASDDLSRGQSTFMVEMSETANILNNATSRSLVILDEIGRGTSTFDGLSIAWAVAEYIHDAQSPESGEQVRTKTLFATHYHELTELSLTKKRVKNYNMSVKDWGDKVLFLRKVVRGAANRSYGIHVAKLAGLPVSVIERSREVLENLERGELNEQGLPKLATAGSVMMREADGQMNIPRLFSGTDTGGENDDDDTTSAVLREIESLDTDDMTPLEALNALSRIKGLIEK